MAIRTHPGGSLLRSRTPICRSSHVSALPRKPPPGRSRLTRQCRWPLQHRWSLWLICNRNWTRLPVCRRIRRTAALDAWRSRPVAAFACTGRHGSIADAGFRQFQFDPLGGLADRRPALAFHARNGRQAGVSPGRRLARHRPRHGGAHARGLARALCRNHGFLRAARADRLPLAAAVAPGDAGPRTRAALFLAGDRRRSIRRSASPTAERGGARGWRRRPCPDWPEIAAAAVRSDDEHDLSLVFSAREEQREFGDRLYQVVAARRMQLIA